MQRCAGGSKKAIVTIVKSVPDERVFEHIVAGSIRGVDKIQRLRRGERGLCNSIQIANDSHEIGVKPASNNRGCLEQNSISGREPINARSEQ